MDKAKLERQIEALKIENAKLKQQLTCGRLERAVERFNLLPEIERDAVWRCYEYIWENYDWWLVWEDFVAHYLELKWFTPKWQCVNFNELPF